HTRSPGRGQPGTHPLGCVPTDPASRIRGIAMQRLVPLSALLAAATCASFGGAMTAVAIPWFVLATTGSGSQTGLVAATEAVGLLVSVALSGPWTDRSGPRRITVLTDASTAVAIAAIPTVYFTVGLSLPALLALDLATV